MPYVNRNDEKKIVALTAMPQNGWGKEFLSDDHADVLLFQNPLVIWDDIRTERNTRLAASDWSALTDTALSREDQNQWFDYRTALRDVPQDFKNPDDVIWPNTPKSGP